MNKQFLKTRLFSNALIWRIPARKILTLTLVTSLATSVPVPFTYASATPNTSATANTPATSSPTEAQMAQAEKDFAADFAKVSDYNKAWGDLEAVPPGQPRGTLAPDRFLLMHQTVLPKEVPVVSRLGGQVLRLHKLSVLISRVDQYLKNIAAGKVEAATFEDVATTEPLTAEQVSAEALEYLANGRRVDTPYFVWIRRRDAEQLRSVRGHLATIFNQMNAARRSGAENPTQAATVRRARLVNWWDVNVVVREGTETMKTMAMADTARYTAASGRTPYFCATDTCRFDLKTKGETLHTFDIDSKVVATYGQFIVFAHRDSFDAASGVQYLSFLDLETYGTNVGNEDIPVFRIPIKTDSPITSLRADKDQLILNEKFWIDHHILQDASDLQQVAFNLTASLVSPSEWDATLPLIDAFRGQVRNLVSSSVEDAVSNHLGMKQAEVLFGRLGQELQTQLDANSKVKATGTDALNKAALEAAKANPKLAEATKAVELYHDRVSKSEALKDRMSSITSRVDGARKLKGRLDLLMSRLLSPRPWASQRIKEALGVYAVKRDAAMPGHTPRGALGALMDHPYINSGVIAAAALAVVSPDSFHQIVNNGLAVGSAVYDYIGFALKGLSEAAIVGTQRSFAALYEPAKALGDQYIYNGNWYRTTVFMSLFVPQVLAVYYIPHFLFNFYRYRQDIKAGRAKNLIEQQTLVKRAYFEKQAQEDAKKHGVDPSTLTAEDSAGIEQWVKDRKDGVHRNPGRISGWFSRLFGKGKVSNEEKGELTALAMEQTAFELANAGATADASPAVADVGSMEKPEFATFWAAARHMVLTGMPSYEYTLLRWASFWNWYAGWRFCSVGFKGVRVCKTNIPLMVSPKPVMWASRVLYPDLFSTVVARREKQLVVPTELNGGLRTRKAYDFADIFSKSWAERMRARAEGSTREQIQNLGKFEDRIIDAEKAVIDVAFRESLAALAKFVSNRKDLEIIFGADPIKSITGPQIRDLSYAAQTFLRTHFESIYDEAMHRFMEKVVDGQGQSPDTSEVATAIAEQVSAQELSDADPQSLKGENPERSLKALKLEAVQLATSRGADLTFDASQARALAVQISRNGQHVARATAQAAKGRLSTDNIGLNAKYNVISNLDPEQNPSMQRWNVVHNRLKSPGALGRAVRAEIAKLLVTLPLNLGLKLFLAAGIMEGAMKPIQEEFWGTNATFYGSHTSFYMLFMSGFAMGMMADAWIKVQMDQRQDDMGEFGQIPKGEDAVKGMTRWYAKQFFAPENSLWKNYVFNNHIVFWNLPAALFNISLFYYAFSGRIDLSLLVAGYVVAFATPLSALHTKIDQAFERAVHFAARGLKSEAWLGDARVQQILLKEQQKARNIFNLANDVYGTVEGEVVGTIEMIPTTLGPRGFARALFGGTLLEEKIVNGILDPMVEAAKGTPGLEHAATAIAKACEELLTHGNPDLVKLHKK